MTLFKVIIGNKIYCLYTLYQNKKIFNIYINNYIKMDYLEKFIENFNKLTYNSQCDYIRNRLLSLDLYEIQFIMFFKKL